MFCSHCGAEVMDGAAFCPKCGTALSMSAPAAPEPEVAPVVEPVVVPAPVATPEPVQPAESVTPLIPTDAAPAVATPAPVPEPVPAYVSTPAPQPAQYVPQPVSDVPPTSGASNPSQPAYVQQPAQGSYGYQPGAPVAPAPAKKKPPVVAIVIGAIVALAVIFGIGGILFGGDDDDYEPSGAYTLDGLDYQGNPTFQAMAGTDGSSLVDTLEGIGWEWSEDKLWFTSSDGNDCFYVFGPNDYEYTYDEIRGLAADGAGEPVVYVLALDDRDYFSAEDALDNITDYEYDKVEWLNEDENTGVALITNGQGETQLILIDYKEDPGFYVINIFNNEAVEQNVASEWLGDDYGRTPEQIWSSLFD